MSSKENKRICRALEARCTTSGMEKRLGKCLELRICNCVIFVQSRRVRFGLLRTGSKRYYDSDRILTPASHLSRGQAGTYQTSASDRNSTKRPIERGLLSKLRNHGTGLSPPSSSPLSLFSAVFGCFFFCYGDLVFRRGISFLDGA